MKPSTIFEACNVGDPIQLYRFHFCPNALDTILHAVSSFLPYPCRGFDGETLAIIKSGPWTKQTAYLAAKHVRTFEDTPSLCLPYIKFLRVRYLVQLSMVKAFTRCVRSAIARFRAMIDWFNDGAFETLRAYQLVEIATGPFE